MAKFILMLAIEVLISIVVIFGNDKKSGKFIFQRLLLIWMFLWLVNELNVVKLFQNVVYVYFFLSVKVLLRAKPRSLYEAKTKFCQQNKLPWSPKFLEYDNRWNVQLFVDRRSLCLYFLSVKVNFWWKLLSTHVYWYKHKNILEKRVLSSFECSAPVQSYYPVDAFCRVTYGGGEGENNTTLQQNTDTKLY